MEAPAAELSADDADVRAVLGGDGDRFAAIVKRHQGRLAAYMTRFTGDRGEIEELLQETFVRAHRALGSYRGDGKLGWWLATIATRVGYRYWRKRDLERGRLGKLVAWMRGRRPEEPSLTLRGGDQDGGGDGAAKVAAVMEKLAARDRLVLTLMHLEGRSVAESATLTGWSESMVKVQAHRARERFRKMWEEVRDEA